ncbi:MAG: hypothetical protein JRF63_13380, partial [Deltaproteobacteria bacterium]|nr:hypothetical protein [Deltaproteobacteria bacterium]
MLLGEILQRDFGLTSEQLEEGLNAQKDCERRIGTVLIAIGHVDADAVATALAEQKGVPAARQKHFDKVDRRTLELVPAHLARLHHAIPLGVATREREELVLAMRDPDNTAAIDEIASMTGLRVRPAIAPEHFIDRYLEQLYGCVPAAVEKSAAGSGVDPRFAPEAEPEPELDLDLVPETAAPARPPDVQLGIRAQSEEGPPGAALSGAVAGPAPPTTVAVGDDAV